MIHGGKFGEFGGQYVTPSLLPVLDELEYVVKDKLNDDVFIRQQHEKAKQFLGYPTPMTKLQNVPEGGADIYIKREDLLHGNSFHSRHIFAQIAVALELNKTRIVSATADGKSGTAVASACSSFGLPCEIYMGLRDYNNRLNDVVTMQVMGATVTPVYNFNADFSAAIDTGLRDWADNHATTYFLPTSDVGPHPLPTIVRKFSEIMGDEVRRNIRFVPNDQFELVAAATEGGNVMGMFHPFLGDTDVDLTVIEAAGKGLETDEHAASYAKGTVGIIHGCKTYVLQDEQGHTLPTHSIAPGMSHPAINPELAHYLSTGRINYDTVTDDEAFDAFLMLGRREGILPSLEASHALAYAYRQAPTRRPNSALVVCLSGRGADELARFIDYSDDNVIDFKPPTSD